MDLAEKMVNPIPISKESLQLGQTKYDIYYGRVMAIMQKVTADCVVNSKSAESAFGKVRKWSDGRIYAILTDGQCMPSHSSQLSVDERWAVISM